jgi:hypothetical protein
MRSILLVSLVAFSSASAGIINLGTVAGAATGFVFASTSASNNDNVVGVSPNNFVIFATQTGMAASLVNPVGVASGGTTEYRTTLSFTNSTGLPLYGILLELFDNGVLVTSNGYDFDFPQFDSGNTAPPWTMTLLNAGQLKFEGADLQNGFSINMAFNIDYPDPGVGGRFMMMTPLSNVPEPTTVTAGLLGLALVACGRWRRG